MIIALSLVALAAGAGTIGADYAGRWKAAYVLRPATMVSIILLAVLRSGGGAGIRYWYFVIAALAVSLVGDVFMMLRKKNFAAGLAAFLTAQLLYCGAFLTTMTPVVDFGTVLPLLLYAMVMMGLLFPHLGNMKIPVAFYILVITVMAGLGIERFVEIGGTAALRAFLAAVLFVVSDSVLAVNRFVRKFPAAQALILSTYFAAQWLFAMSV
jgi:uncharacterized membrane protein YhhN